LILSKVQAGNNDNFVIHNHCAIGGG